MPLSVPAWLSMGPGGAWTPGTARDASPAGVLVELREHPPEAGGTELAEIALPSGRRTMRVAEIRREAAPSGALIVALRVLGEEEPARRTAPGREDRPPWPACARARPRAVVRADLRALGAEAYDLGLHGAASEVPRATAAWAAEIARELGAPCDPPPSAWRLEETVRTLWDLS